MGIPESIDMEKYRKLLDEIGDLFVDNETTEGTVLLVLASSMAQTVLSAYPDIDTAKAAIDRLAVGMKRDMEHHHAKDRKES